MDPQQQQNVVVEVLSKQLQEKRMKVAPSPARGAAAEYAMANLAQSNDVVPRARVGTPAPTRSTRPPTDTLMSWNALPNEWIVPCGVPDATPVLGGSVSRWSRAKGVVRFPSSVQRIEFSTDNISAENQGVLVEGWACWRVGDPRVAVQKLDVSDPDNPMLHTSRILAVECAGIMKGLISVKTVQDLLKRREDLIDKLRQKLKPTEERWGLSFDEIGISEVQILSQEVFENLQRPFRNEAREVAATSDLDTEERIASKTAAQKERVTRLTAENERRLHELEMQNQTQTSEMETAEEKKRLLIEKELKDMRIAEEKREKLLQATAHREVEEQRIAGEHQAALVAIDAKRQRRLHDLKAESEAQLEAQRLEQAREAAEAATARERRLAELRADGEAELEALRVATARQAEELRLGAEVRATREKADLARLAAAQELAEAEQALAEARKRGDVALRDLEAKAEADGLRARLSVRQEEETFRLKVAAEERRILGQLSDAEIRAKVVEALPQIASSIRIGDVRWYGGGAGADGPTNILSRALDQVLDVAAAHGLEVRRKPNAAAEAKAS